MQEPEDKTGIMLYPKFLRCLEHRLEVFRDGEFLTCRQQCRIPITRDIPRFVSSANYAAHFGAQWNRFRQTQLDSFTGTTISRDRLTRILGGSLAVTNGKLVLEAGCGAGRFTEVLLAAGASVVAVDYSSAVDANYQNFKGRPGYFVLQADILHLPFESAQFDLVICVGVVQHTPDPLATIRALGAQVRPGGLLVFDHYAPGYPTTPSRWLLRRLLLKTSPSFSLRFCGWLTAALWPIHRLLGRLPDRRFWRKLRMYFLWLSPVVDYQAIYPQLGPELLRTWAILDTHDTLTDAYKHVRDPTQIRSYLIESGMADIEVSSAGNGVEARARKPQR